MQIIYKHCISLVVFLSLTIYFFNPVIFENKELKQHDIEQWKNGANEIIDYRKNTNKEALWTNSMFSGMPAYLIDVKWKNDIIIFLHKLLGLWLPHPVSLIFISFISFYFMLICFGVRPEISIFGNFYISCFPPTCCVPAAAFSSTNIKLEFAWCSHGILGHSQQRVLSLSFPASKLQRTKQRQNLAKK